MVFNKISKNLPETPFPSENWKHLNELLLADPNYNVPALIDILLGADYYGDIMKQKLLKGNKNEPSAQLTEFGWVILGKITTPNNTKVIKVSSYVTSTQIDEQLKKFWELEELHPPRNQTKEEKECEDFFDKTHRRLTHGRYEVKIPFHTDPKFSLGESRKMALARFLQVERRLLKDETLRETYVIFMQEYARLGHMEEVPETEESNTAYYLPHHAVQKQDSTTTKLRVVFDGSAKTTSGKSLNDLMLNGPTLQQDITSIIMRWRLHQFVFKADIEKMFRQISINESDQIYQRILWRETPNEKIKSFKLKTVTYGTTAATYLATKVLCQLAQDEKQKYPIASTIAQRDFYVDDLLSGADTLSEALNAQSQLINLFKSGGFNLRKWSSNNEKLTAHLSAEACEGGLCPIQIEDTIKTLGISWNPKLDRFEFNISTHKTKEEPTKRTILAEIAKLFDPLGWFAPVIIQAKLLMQGLWIAGIGWDEKLNAELKQQWVNFKEGLHDIERITIPRWIEHNPQGNHELHGFSDASEKAFAAAVYYKTINTHGVPVIPLVAAKTKVAHLRNKISLPRLELCGAVLLAKLLKTVQEAMNLEQVIVYAWTDSMITLGWIKGNPNKYKTFVANRIAEIQSLMHPSQWHHVKSNSNPADLASRGMSAGILNNSRIWWEGPDWLKSTNYPTIPKLTEEVSDVELKANCLMTNTTFATDIINFNRFSSAIKLKRTIAYCFRYIAMLKKRVRKNSQELPTYLTTAELDIAHKTIIKVIQQSEFSAEINSMKTSKLIKGTSNLRSLNPFIDESGILRVAGRLENSQLQYQQKHQVILPKNHVSSRMVITEAHKAVLHGGIQATLGQVRTKYWILQGKSVVRTTVRSCVKCFKFKRATSTQLTGMPPKERITPCPPFLNTGIDYAGSFAIRVSRGRGTKSYKGYIALFICFSTKAIHLELVSDLTTTAFLAAFKRFAARRGTPLNIYSDNGTNFVGARNQLNKELKLAIKQANSTAAEEMANNGTNWNFIPPASPHFGGLWEAGVKSTKHHLTKIIGETMLTFEEFSTVLTQVEACLNSRPILPMSNDLEDYEALTPGHFLIGRPLISHPESDVSDINITQRWALVTKITQRYWKIWSMEYLTNLQQRPKWTATKTNYEAGQLVLIKDEQLPPTKWALGRITKTHPGPDGLTRVVSIKGPKNSECKRPITKICLLPIEDNHVALTSPSPAQELSSKEEPKRQQKRTTTNNHTISGFTLVYAPLLILSMIIGICCSSGTSYNITKFANEPGIYFEYIADLQFTNNNWNIIVFYNLTNYNAELIAYRRCIDKLEHFCSRDPENVTNGSKRELCALIIPPFQQSLLEIEHKNELLNPQKAIFGRNKRGAINIIGNIASELFGVLDDRDAARYEQEIEKLKQDNDHLLALIKNQTSIIDITVNVFKKRQADIDEHWFVFKQQIEAALEANDANNRFLALSLHTLLMMTSFKEIQETLIEAVLDTHNQVTTTRLLTVQQLKVEVDLMARSIPTDIMLPTIDHTDDILALYQLMTTKTKLKGNYLIFEIKIPLVYKERYQMYKPIPLPTTSKPSMFVRPQVEYLVTDLL